MVKKTRGFADFPYRHFEENDTHSLLFIVYFNALIGKVAVVVSYSYMGK